MAKSKEKVVTVNLDEVLDKKELIPIASLESAPVSADVPRGWPPLFEVQGATWYEKVITYQNQYGHKVIPVRYKQVTDTDVIERDEEDLKQISEQLEPIWARGEE